MMCPDCGNMVELDCTPEYNEAMPWEVACFVCGWFHADRFETKQEAEKVLQS